VRAAFEKHGSSKENFGDIGSWPVSFTIGGLLSSTGSVLMIHQCDFANLSTTQRRVLDFKLELATERDDHPDIILNTATMGFQPEQWSAKDVGRTEGTLPNPLILEPGAFAEGIVEFEMRPEERQKYLEILDHNLLAKMDENSVFYVIDRRSRLIKKTKLAEHYDARTGAVWRTGCPASLPRRNGVC